MESAQPSNRTPNIVLIFPDEHRWDALGCAGNPVVQTPNIDRLAAEGCHFTRTYCQSPVCIPSRASLITGRYPHQHGVAWQQVNLNPEWDTMMKHLQSAGYVTGAVGKMMFYDKPIPGATMDLRGNEWFNRSFGLDFCLEEFDKYIHVAYPRAITPHSEYLKANGHWQDYLVDIDRTNPLDIASAARHGGGPMSTGRMYDYGA